MKCYDDANYYELICENAASEKSYKTTVIIHPECRKCCHHEEEISCYIVTESDLIYPYPSFFHAKCHDVKICYSIIGFNILSIGIYGGIYGNLS